MSSINAKIEQTYTGVLISTDTHALCVHDDVLFTKGYSRTSFINVFPKHELFIVDDKVVFSLQKTVFILQPQRVWTYILSSHPKIPILMPEKCDTLTITKEEDLITIQADDIKHCFIGKVGCMYFIIRAKKYTDNSGLFDDYVIKN